MTDDDLNLYAHFHSHLAADPDRTLLATEDGADFSNGDIESLSGRIASRLAALGVRSGDRVSVQVEKSPQALCLYLACLRAGFVFHPLNPAYKTRELEFFLSDAEPAAVVCDPRNESGMSPLAAAAGAGIVLTLDADGRGSLIDEAVGASADFGHRPRGRDELAALLYSSGTTGVPKGIMLTHGNLLSNTRTLVCAWGFAASDRLLHALPIFHVHGLFVAIGCVLLSGASMRWLPRFAVEPVIRYLPECTVMMGVPTYYTRLLADPRFERATAAHVRLFTSGSAPLRPETFKAFEARTGQRIVERYGMTETNMNTSNPLAGERRPGTVGLPLPGVEVRVTGDAGDVLAAATIGHLEVKGPNVFAGYWKLPGATADAFTADGWFRTGDEGLIDESGYVSIVGRAKDMIISGGLNVYPKEVERFIDGLPGVKESAVIGVPHPDFGEGVVAVVARAEGEQTDESAIIASCKRQLAGFKVPKRVVFVAELPRNTMAKVQKNRLREQFAELFVVLRPGPDATGNGALDS